KCHVRPSWPVSSAGSGTTDRWRCLSSSHSRAVIHCDISVCLSPSRAFHSVVTASRVDRGFVKLGTAHADELASIFSALPCPICSSVRQAICRHTYSPGRWRTQQASVEHTPHTGTLVQGAVAHRA